MPAALITRRVARHPAQPWPAPTERINTEIGGRRRSLTVTLQPAFAIKQLTSVAVS
jgi:hypothetical protein